MLVENSKKQVVMQTHPWLPYPKRWRQFVYWWKLCSWIWLIILGTQWLQNLEKYIHRDGCRMIFKTISRRQDKIRPLGIRWNGIFTSRLFSHLNNMPLLLSSAIKPAGPQYLTRWQLFSTKKITLLYRLSTFMIDSYPTWCTIEYFIGLVIIIGRQHRRLWRHWEMSFYEDDGYVSWYY